MVVFLSFGFDWQAVLDGRQRGSDQAKAEASQDYVFTSGGSSVGAKLILDKARLPRRMPLVPLNRRCDFCGCAD